MRFTISPKITNIPTKQLQNNFLNFQKKKATPKKRDGPNVS